jgi:hypothetical protein
MPSRRPSIPLVDAPLLSRAAGRTRVCRIALAALLVALLGAGVALAGRGAPAVTGGPAAAHTTVLVIDLSGSISAEAYKRISRTLATFASADESTTRVGLVFVSDLAQEALPPGTRPADLRPFVRYFRPKPKPRNAEEELDRLLNPFPPNPWAATFSKGTAMYSFTDVPKLRGELLTYARSSLELRVVALPPVSEESLRFVQRFLGERRVLAGARLVPAAVAGGGGSFPLPLVVVAGLLAVALAANELLNGALRWREGPQ